MNFTREPIIETIITPKEGFKLVIRNSNGNSQEEYSVSSIEVVSFGKSFFFRSLEKPKSFLLPVSDYEVLESRETRSVLKKPKIEKTIKIGGGKIPKLKDKEAPIEEEEEILPEESNKRDRGKSARRRQSKKEEKVGIKEPTKPPEQPVSKEPVQPQRRTLLPPPTSLISEQITRYKDYLMAEGALLRRELDKKEKIEELPKEPTEELSFLPQEEVTSQNPHMFDEESSEEDKIVELKEEASTSPERED